MGIHTIKKAVFLLLSAELLITFLSTALIAAASPAWNKNPLGYNSEDLQKIPLAGIADQFSPSPEFLPAQIISIQLKALQNNDSTGSGIETVVNFTSPASKTASGNLDQFKQLLKNQYAPILNFRCYVANTIHIEANEAQQIVIITDKNGSKAAYLFLLSRQVAGSFKGCWLTDSLIRLPYEEKRL